MTTFNLVTLYSFPLKKENMFCFAILAIKCKTMFSIVVQWPISWSEEKIIFSISAFGKQYIDPFSPIFRKAILQLYFRRKNIWQIKTFMESLRPLSGQHKRPLEYVLNFANDAWHYSITVGLYHAMHKYNITLTWDYRILLTTEYISVIDVRMKYPSCFCMRRILLIY